MTICTQSTETHLDLSDGNESYCCVPTKGRSSNFPCLRSPPPLHVGAPPPQVRVPASPLLQLRVGTPEPAPQLRVGAPEPAAATASGSAAATAASGDVERNFGLGLPILLGSSLCWGIWGRATPIRNLESRRHILCARPSTARATNFFHQKLLAVHLRDQWIKFIRVI